MWVSTVSFIVTSKTSPFLWCLWQWKPCYKNFIRIYTKVFLFHTFLHLFINKKNFYLLWKNTPIYRNLRVHTVNIIVMKCFCCSYSVSRDIGNRDLLRHTVHNCKNKVCTLLTVNLNSLNVYRRVDHSLFDHDLRSDLKLVI